jgi:hypothetical protein
VDLASTDLRAVLPVLHADDRALSGDFTGVMTHRRVRVIDSCQERGW